MTQTFLDVPPELGPIQMMLGEGLLRVEQRFDEQLASELLPVERLCAHVERYRGKMLRPALVMLSGLACGASGISEEHVTIAAVCEMVHMATLVHDDVLDEAENRRRGRTVNHLYGNEAAVILGDYLIAGAYHLCTSIGSVEAARAIGEVSMTLCGGELLQLHYRDDYSLDEATYFAILERKTAALIGVSCRLGAQLAGAAPAVQEALDRFGRRLGVAFQIQDDLLDLLGEERVVGKSVGKDLEKGKLTLPVLLHLGHLDPGERGSFLELLERAGEGDAAAAGELRDRLVSSGAVEAARARARTLVEEAREGLRAAPRGPAREMLDLMARAVVERRY
ncbi:MAG: polyprenyl synthetase family protein [Phycisphaerales bacterium]|nr:polyprenyl synthetase family protein [Phycisphaerales bacterium]